MPRITGGVTFNLEHENDEVTNVINLIKKLPDALEAYNSSISIKNKTRISKSQMGIVEDWVEKTKGFENYLKGI